MYNLSISYHFYFKSPQESCIIKVFKINNVPYSFDYLPEIEQNNPEVLVQAQDNTTFTEEDLYLGSYYLTLEMVHPLIFDIEIDHPELLPVDN